MEFEKKLEEMLSYIKFNRGASKSFSFRGPGNPAYWALGTGRNYMDRNLQQLFDDGFVFSEEKELMMERTIEELLLNSCIDGCRESDDLNVMLNSYFGDKGIVFHIKDDGNGFDYKSKLAQRKRELHLYDRNTVLSDSRESKRSGHGMYCLLTFPDDFSYNKQGNEVAVRFDLGK